MKELAENLEAETEALLSRWDGRPDRIIEDVFRVRDLDSKEVTDLELTNYQRKFVSAYFYGDESTLNVLKGRRTGYSFVTCACLLLDAIKTPHGFFAITAPSKSQAKDRIEDVYDLMDWSRLEFDPVIDNRDEIELSNNATLMAFAGSPDTSRGGDSADTLFIDEMDFLEDQQESMRAFSPFVALGDAQTVEISTPENKNSLFMQDHDTGSEHGEDGIISIYQPAFQDPSSIDEQRSLLKQDVEPVMPYLNLEKAERDRARDPQGFRQEYLCEPVQDQYRFFSESTVLNAAQKGESAEYLYGPTVGSVESGRMVMGVDIAGGGKDDTAVVIVEHAGNQRKLRYHETIDNQTLRQASIEPAVARNPSAIADRINQLYHACNVDYVITDATNIGEGFDSEIRQTIGRGVQSFNFSDKESVADMMGDLNYAFHNDLVTLINDDQLTNQILAIVKEKKRKSTRPRFSGKDHAPNGKDDLAIALALAAYPPTMNDDAKQLTQKEDDGRPTGQVGEQIHLDGATVDTSDSESTGSRSASHRKGISKRTGRDGRYGRRYSRN